MKQYTAIVAMCLSLSALAIALSAIQSKDRAIESTDNSGVLDYIDMIKKIQQYDRKKLQKLNDRIDELESQQNKTVIDRIDDQIQRSKEANEKALKELNKK